MSRCGRNGLPPPQPYPWLLYRHGKGYTDKTFRTIGPESEKQQYSRRCKLPQLRGKDVIASFKGWLLLQNRCYDAGITGYGSSNYQHYVLWNPSTFESIDLAPLKLGKNHKIDYYLLYGDGDDGDGMLNLLLFESTMPCIFRCRFVRHGGGGVGHWVAIHYRKEIEAYYKEYGGYEYPLHLERPLFCDFKLYALTHCGERLVEIEIRTDADSDDAVAKINYGVVLITWLGCSLPMVSLRSDFDWSFLVESKGEIFDIVFEGFERDEILFNEPVAFFVFKLNFSDMSWIKLESFEDKLFFICIGTYQWNRSILDIGSNWTNCFSLAVGEGERGNSIYFIKPNENYLYCYNMDDSSISVTLPCPSLPSPWLSPVWVMPEVLDHEGGKSRFQSKNLKDVNLEDLKNVDVEDQEETLTTHVSDLGLDLLAFIAKKLSCFDYMFFRESCNMFSSAAPLIRWRTVVSGAEVATRHCLSRTCLVIPGKDIWCIVDPYGRKYLITPPKLLPEDVIIHCSKDGWLLLCCSDEPKTIVFFNPFTKAVIRLPHLDTSNVQTGFTFSSLPTSDDFVVVSIDLEFGWISMNLFFGGESNWETIEFEVGSVPSFQPSPNNPECFLPNFNNPVFWNGAIYFLGQNGNLGVLTIDQEERRHSWQPIDKPQSPCKSFHQNFLLECGGELMSVFVGYMGRRVEVFKLSSCKVVWEKVHTLGNYVLFISRSSSFSTLAKSPGMENRIYFPRLCEGNPVYYSLKTRKLHVVGKNDSLPDFCGTLEQLLSGWIEPRWS